MDPLTTHFLRQRLYLLKIAFNSLHDSDGAKDILQDAFIRLWEKRDKIRLDGDLKHLMAQTVRRLCVDYLRHTRTGERIMKRIEAGSIEVVTEHWVSDFVPRALRHIKSERSRQIMSMLFIEGQKDTDVAQILGVKTQTVRNVSHESVKVLRENKINLI